ncbi:zinc ABC transporter substrate-binding protein ZnuA [Marinobacterium arenosum]|uniref:zinc ABC transporter substrate-binding protein ZnuA n=1 Tax=Marinobacterium arenosum TaxID=2862496 RepID=UPI001C9881F7|nr:zinc ABC transporter substrate-binding protein ZnuA [Marinobacterium arenosum]MBY4676501.1 zinc ABC transporter substrate-binding protein ZnuA [Marinobacterium arenosum]
MIKSKVFFAALLLSLAALPAWAEVRVVASVKPLQLIAAAVVDGIGRAEVLIPPGASPHHYALKPSDMRKLGEADQLIWVGPQLEMFLAKTLRQQAVPALALLPMEDGGDQHEADEEQDTTGGHHHHDHERDLHLWMNPLQALRAAEQLSEALAGRFPQHRETLTKNLERFAASLLSKDRQLQQQLQPLQQRGFFVFHDAYSGFVKRYGLKQLGYFTVDPGRPTGTRRLAEIRQRLKAAEAVCVFGEPQFKAAVVRTVTEGLSVGYAELDPLASEQAVSADGYALYLQQLADRFSGCLGANLTAKP